MSVIHKLDPKMIAIIAAGQVIERPSSVVKELVENSLDAKASSITIKLVDGGRQEITVIDNGLGMSKDDVLLSVHPHATSKVSSINDLQKISSFGFRGEALASIALASNMIIQSKKSNDTFGHLVHIKHGKNLDNHPIGMANGTIVKVTELFKFLPARKKFLKSAPIEIQQILKVLLPIFLVHLGVSFKVEHNNSVIVECSAGQTFLERVMIVVNQEYHSQLLPVQHSQAGYAVSGFIGTPQIASPASSKQFFWVNSRSVVHQLVNKTVKSLYGTLLEPRAHPVFFLQLQSDPQAIDVNVHPQKTAIHFSEEEIVMNVLMSSIRKTLDESGLGYTVTTNNSSADLAFNDSGMDYKVADQLRQSTQPWSVKNITVSATTKFFQLHKLYIFFETDEGMLIIDQHAAHERILYEQFLKAYQDHSKLHQLDVVPPQKLNLQKFDEVSETTLEVLQRIGISVEKRANEYFVTKIPVLLKHRNYISHIRALIEQSAELLPYELDPATHKTLSYLACRSAIKAGEPLSSDEQKNLVEKLLVTKTNYTCPHGRPVMLNVSLTELAHLFKRTGF